VAGVLGPNELLGLYARGLFPMADSRDDECAAIVDPPRRGILPLEALHIPRRLRKTIRQAPYEIRIDTAFDEVVFTCAAHAPDREETWISHGIANLYGQLYKNGNAHSVECWQDDHLVGGLYGVKLGGAFFGESMFSRCRDASKIALIHLAARLVAGSFCLLDTQFLTQHLAQFGAVEIDREAYHLRLQSALERTGDFTALAGNASGLTVLEILDAHR
jgi:leucyl/phenylalanyl-tRNA---protein transferase